MHATDHATAGITHGISPIRCRVQRASADAVLGACVYATSILVYWSRILGLWSSSVMPSASLAIFVLDSTIYGCSIDVRCSCMRLSSVAKRLHDRDSRAVAADLAMRADRRVMLSATARRRWRVSAVLRRIRAVACAAFDRARLPSRHDRPSHLRPRSTATAADPPG